MRGGGGGDDGGVYDGRRKSWGYLKERVSISTRRISIRIKGCEKNNAEISTYIDFIRRNY